MHHKHKIPKLERPHDVSMSCDVAAMHITLILTTI